MVRTKLGRRILQWVQRQAGLYKASGILGGVGCIQYQKGRSREGMDGFCSRYMEDRCMV